MLINIQVFLCIILVKGVKLNLFENMRHNHKLDGFILKQIAGISFKECWTNCEQRPSCKSINYQRRFHLCTLNSENDENRLTEGLGFVYKAKETGLNYVQICGGTTCAEGEVCISNNYCEVQECPRLDGIVANTEILGNMVSCGNKALIRCRVGYQSSTGTDVISSECSDNGTWSQSSSFNCSRVMTNCKDVYDSGDNTTGVKTIFPDELNPIDVLCVMDVDGGGWTVFQQRENDSDFFWGWKEYQFGFGDSTNFWLGLENIHRLTLQGNYELRVDMKNGSNENAAAKYTQFNIGNETTGYRLSVSGYSNDPDLGIDPGDSLSGHTGMSFSTNDMDNDTYQGGSCALLYQMVRHFRTVKKNCEI